MHDSQLTDAAFRDYLQKFHSALKETAEKYLPNATRNRLVHLSYLPARIVGYVSTSFGVAFEYVPQNISTFEVRESADRVENLFFGAPHEIQESESLFMIGGPACGLRDATLKDSFPLRLAYRDASVSLVSIEARSAGWKRTVYYAELYGDNRLDTWSAEHAISRAKDEVLAALVEIRRAEDRGISLAQYISELKKRTVLVLGSYTAEGEIRISNIIQVLKEYGYNPVTLKDVPDEPEQSLDQKTQMLGSLSRFVVVDDSEASGHLKEVKICEDSRWITVMLRARGMGSSYVTAASSAFSKVVFEAEYDPPAPKHAVHEAVRWAEEKIEDIKKVLDNAYPWRAAGSKGPKL